jgi:hypothetical protein
MHCLSIPTSTFPVSSHSPPSFDHTAGTSQLGGYLAARMACMRIHSGLHASASSRSVCEVSYRNTHRNHNQPAITASLSPEARPRKLAAFATSFAQPRVAGPRRLKDFIEGPFEHGEDNEKTWDILGIAQSMVDVTTEQPVDDRTLLALNVEKGGRR